MAGTDCHACVLKVAYLSNPLGSSNEPLGVCKNCFSLCCGHHGHRDPNVPEYVCVECDPAILQASAAALAIPGRTDILTLQEMKDRYYRSFQGDETWVFKSINDFANRRPGYRDDIFTEAQAMRFPWNQLPQDLSLAIQQIPEEGRELLLAALLITVRYEFKENQVDRILRSMRRLYFT